MRRLVLCSLLILFVLLSNTAPAQNDSSCPLRISVLTCSPGQELYSLFGHSALRIVDLAKHTDIIYNWGTFEGYGEPDFYLKFMRGKLRYFVSPDKLDDFMYEYQYDGRSVTEQILDLSCEDKLRIKHAVDSNMLPQNRFYKYDFTFDNCTTRIRDIIAQNTASLNLPDSLVPAGTTFRNMLYFYLDRGSQPWSKLGIDILLGSKLDKVVTTSQAMFLPEYLMAAIDLSTRDNKTLTGNKRQLLPAQPYGEMKGIYEPLLIIFAVCLLFFTLSLAKSSTAKRLTRIIDSLLLYLTGLLGFLLLFMWFFTDHAACADNYNLLWALPPNLIIAFSNKQKQWVRSYFKLTSIVLLLTIMLWLWLPQQLNIAILPLAVYLLYRYIAHAGFSFQKKPQG